MNKTFSLKYRDVKTAQELLKVLQDIRDNEGIQLQDIKLSDSGAIEVRKVTSEVEEAPHYELNFGVYD